MTLAISESAEGAPSRTAPCPTSPTRSQSRFPFVAEADVIDPHRRRSLAVSVSQLSTHGCYLDTPDGFTVGTEVVIVIRHAGGSCALPGKLIYVHKGWGMGVLFSEAASEQRAVLDAWLAELESKYSQEYRSLPRQT